MNDKTYTLIKLVDYSPDELEQLISDSIQTSTSTLRKSLDGKKAVLKWRGDSPISFKGTQTYNHDEILVELSKSEWTPIDA